MRDKAKRLTIAAAIGAVVVGAFLAFVPVRYSQATDADLTDILAIRAGHAWHSGTFAGVTVEDGQITGVAVDGHRMAVAPDFAIKRVLMRRSALGVHMLLYLLDVPDSDSWNGYTGSRAWYETPKASGEASHVFIVEQPR